MIQGRLYSGTASTPIVGITYDLRDDYLRMGLSAEQIAEFDGLATIDAIADALHSLGYATTRIGHIGNLNARLAAGECWDLVFNIAEGLHGLAREAQVPTLLEAFQIPYTFSDGVVLALALHKGLTKHVVRDLGVATPEFAVAKDVDDLQAIHFGWHLRISSSRRTGYGTAERSNNS